MNRYFSCSLCGDGYTSAFCTIYKNDPSAGVYIITGGDDFERSEFFARLVKNLHGYSLTLFNPFYDEAVDGIYIENLNTYIISDNEFKNISPLLPEIWEKTFCVIDEKEYPTDLLQEIIFYKTREYNHYKQASKKLQKASFVKDRIHTEISKHLNEEKLINYIKRFCLRELNHQGEKGNGTIRLLSSVTPLGYHTHYDTIFDLCEDIIDIRDDTGFVSSIIIGVIKDYAIKEKMPFIVSPTYFASDFSQFILFPSIRLGLCVSDRSHRLPFEPSETVNVSRFLKRDVITGDKIQLLLSVEEKFLQNSILNVYDGRDERFRYNNLTTGYSNADKAKENADKLTEKIIP